MAIDKELVKRKITLILEDLQKMKPLAELPEDKFLADYQPRLLAERLLERIIGRMLDINYHIVTETLLTTPKDYFDSFLKLSEVGVLNPDESQEFAKLAGLRNRLAHEYNGINEDLIFEVLKDFVSSLPSYLKAVDIFVE